MLGTCPGGSPTPELITHGYYRYVDAVFLSIFDAIIIIAINPCRVLGNAGARLVRWRVSLHACIHDKYLDVGIPPFP